MLVDMYGVVRAFPGRADEEGALYGRLNLD